MDDIIDAINQLVGVAILLRYTVDATRNGQIMWIGYKAFMNDGRPKRTERVH